MDIKLFSGSYSQSLAKKIASLCSIELGEVDLTRFSDGECSISYNVSLRGSDTFIVQSTISPSESIIELLLMIDAAKRAAAKSVTVIIPYYGYARQDRKNKPREPISASLIANILQSAGANRVITCELHADQIQGFFNIPLVHLQSTPIFIKYIKSQSLDIENTLFAAPDLGSVKRAEIYARYFNKPLVICNKRRDSPNEVASIQIIGDVTKKNIILVDDIIDTGKTLHKSAEELLKNGALSVRAICTHGILSNNAIKMLSESRLRRDNNHRHYPIQK